MDDTKVKGIVLNAQDYKDGDKLITILTPQGKISFVARGVKKTKAKLKPASMPFCFADFVLTQKNTSYILISADVIDSFFDITKDYDAYCIGCKMLELCNKLSQDDCSKLLVLLLKSLKLLSYEKVMPKIVFIKFLVELLTEQGFKLNLEKCASCSSDLMTKIYLDFNSGELVCPACKNMYCQEISKQVFTILRLETNTDFEKISTLKFYDKQCDEVIDVLLKNIKFKFNV